MINKNKTPFFNYNGTHVAVIGKNGSSAIAMALCYALQPDYNIISASGNEDVITAVKNSPGWQSLIPKIFDPVNPIIPVRDPVERFRSGCAQEGRTAEEGLHLIKNGHIENGLMSCHFRPVSDYLKVESRLFKFPEHVSEMAAAIGVDELPLVNTSVLKNGPKPDLTEEEIQQVQDFYADDIALYESITEAGQTYTAPPAPATEELKAAKIQELESDRYRAEVAGLVLPSGQFISTDKDTQSELGKALSIISTVNPALEIDWKFPDGSIVSLDAPQIQQIAGAVFAHVQATRTKYKEKAVLVEAATTKDELNSITW